MERGIKLEFKRTLNYVISFKEDVLPLEVVEKIKQLNIQYEEGFIGEDDLCLGVLTALSKTDIDIPLFLDSTHEVKSDEPDLKLTKVLEVNL